MDKLKPSTLNIDNSNLDDALIWLGKTKKSYELDKNRHYTEKAIQIIRTYKRETEWISVKDKLPALDKDDYGWSMSEPVLVFNKYGEHYIATIEQHEDEPTIWKEIGRDSYSIDEGVITHWKRLPKKL